MPVLKILIWFQNHPLETHIGMPVLKCQTALQSREQWQKQWLWVWVGAALPEETDMSSWSTFPLFWPAVRTRSVLSIMVRTAKLSLTCNGIKGLLHPNWFEEYTHNLINPLVTNLQLFSVTVQSNTSPHPYSLVWENSSRDGIFVLDLFCMGTSDGVSGSLLAASLCLLPILLLLHSPYWQRGKDLFFKSSRTSACYFIWRWQE